MYSVTWPTYTLKGKELGEGYLKGSVKLHLLIHIIGGHGRRHILSQEDDFSIKQHT